MNNKRKALLTPKLRFPEFRGARGWTASQLIDLTHAGLSNGVFNDPKKVGAGYKLINVGDMYIDTTIVEERLSLLTLSVSDFQANQVRHGDIFFTRSSLVKSGIAVSNIYLGNSSDVTFDGHLIRFRANTNTVAPLFAHYLFKTTPVREQLVARGKSGTMTTIGQSDVGGVMLSYPEMNEQRHVADCLSSLDELIAAQARKVDVLNTHKKGLMQQIFPREGETQPRLRFPEFRNTGDWKLLSIGDKVDLLSGYPFDGLDISQDSTGVPLLRGINVTEGRVRHNSEIDRYFTGSVEALEKYKLQVSDLVIGMDGSKVGKNSALITTADAGALLIQRVARLRAKSVDLIRFIFQQINSSTFHRYVDKINTSSGIPHISAKQINEFSIAFPSDQEQQRIADCLTSLDAFITSATRELDTLKTHKKGLVQQLFPLAEGLDA